jgi:hypothetical protein
MPLLSLTTRSAVVINNNMESKARLIEKSRTVVNESAFFEVVLWHLPSPVPGSRHAFKYRPALVVNGVCVLRYDNERGKGDHRHMGIEKTLLNSPRLKPCSRRFKPTWKGYCNDNIDR